MIGSERRHDLPASWTISTADDEFAGRTLAVNGMLLDMLAAVARKDYVDRRRRQAEGTAKAQAASVYKGRPEDAGRNAGIATMLRAGSSWQQIEQAFGCSRNTIARVRKRLDAAARAAEAQPLASQVSTSAAS